MEFNINDILPKTIYKYRDVNSDDHLRIITHQEIYFAKPSEFLEPYECKYVIDREYVKDENNIRNIYSKIYGINRNNPNIDGLIKNNPITDTLINEIELLQQKMYDRFLGVFAGSTTCNNNHLWEVFGANHKGFCVELDFKEIFSLKEGTIGTIGKVDYVEAEYLPKSKVYDFNEKAFMVYINDLILKLPIEFIDEQEYRIQKFITNEFDRKKIINKNSIKSIILGYKMTRKQRESIIELIKLNLPNTLIKRLKYQSGRIIEIVI